MPNQLKAVIDSYNPDLPLAQALTAPAGWYMDARLAEFERASVFARSWQMVGRAAQVRESGRYISGDIAGEPFVIVRARDDRLRGFFNVCRHHAAAVITEAEGEAEHLRCPYHGWTYSLAGELMHVPEFAGVCEFDRAANGLAPMEIGEAEGWLFARVAPGELNLSEFIGTELIHRLKALGLGKFHWFERRRYLIECNWKVFVDNYLDGGYHVAHLHKGLNNLLAPGKYRTEVGARYCWQSAELDSYAMPNSTAAVRQGDRAVYCWIYPNFMINCYQNVMDTNLVRPLGVDRCEVIFDYYFYDITPDSLEQNHASIEVSETIQEEDRLICESVQRGLRSRSYATGRLSVQREAGEHLFHRLLHADLAASLSQVL